MKLLKKTIFTGFAPNIMKPDLRNVWSFLLPWQWQYWQKGKHQLEFEGWLKNHFNKSAFVFDSGRSALFFGLQSLGVKAGDEVLIQSFTCVVVINAIKFLGAKPVYVDIENDFNINLSDLRKKIGSRAKVLIIQHSFGLPAALNELLAIAKEHNLKIIEDCAHAFGAEINGQKLGTFGDLGMFSFGSDKVISCVRGGALITANSELASKIFDYQKVLPWTSYSLILQDLLHFIAFSICKPIYHLGIGKWLLAIGKKINLFGRIIYPAEKRGEEVPFYPSQLPNALAKILLDKLPHLAEITNHQRKIAKLYDEKISNLNIIKPEWNDNSIWLRYTILVNNPEKLHAQAKKQRIILGNWYDAPVAPADIDLSVIDYTLGSCPNDEKISLQCVNLPTDININETEVERIVKLINTYGN